MLPIKLIAPLKVHLEKTKAMHDADLGNGFGSVYLPYALAKKYPHAARDWAWQYVFASNKLSVDPREYSFEDGVTEKQTRRHHIQDQAFQRVVRQAVVDCGLSKRATPHTFRHKFCRAFN